MALRLGLVGRFVARLVKEGAWSFLPLRKVKLQPTVGGIIQALGILQPSGLLEATARG